MDANFPQSRLQFQSEENNFERARHAVDVLSAAVKTLEPPGKVKLPPVFRSLVEQDRLFYRIRRTGRSPVADQDLLVRQEESLGFTFRTSFQAVWDRIPTADRVTILTHWAVNEEIFRMTRDGYPAENLPRPLIEIVDDMPTEKPECINLGLDLRFPILLVLKCPSSLPYEIAWLLAQVYNIRTGKPDKLYAKMVDGPMDLWEESNPRVVICDGGKPYVDPKYVEANDAELARLESAFRRKYDRAIAAIVRRWGMTRPKK